MVDSPLSWLFSTQRHGITLGLETMQHLLDALGNPEKKIPVLHIAGTNGKGSVSAITESILRAAGYRTGLYTSPHLVDFRERIQINGRSMEESSLKKGIQRLQVATQNWKNLPTFFELTTALAFDYFAEQQCDVVVLETGMGGLLDATNLALHKNACAITPISFDHQAWLGKTLTLIAQQKAGIIRPGVPVVSAPQCSEVALVLQEEASRKQAPLHFITTPLSREIPVALLGDYQRWNAALAVELICHSGFNVSQQALKKGLAMVSWPGRFQPFLLEPVFKVAEASKEKGAPACRPAVYRDILEDASTGATQLFAASVDCENRFLQDNSLVEHLLILDGAHNEAGAAQLVATWKELFEDERCTLIFGALKDKEWEKALSLLKKIAATVILVPVASPRTVPLSELLLKSEDKVVPSLEKALESLKIVPLHKGVFPLSAKERCSFFDFLKKRKKNLLSNKGSHAPILVAGSLFLVGEALAFLEGKSYYASEQ